MRSLLAAFASALLLLACTTEQSPGSATNVTPDGGAAPACEEGATRCDGELLATCTNGAFGAPAACEGESVCRDGACRAPSAEQLAQAEELASMLAYIRAQTAWHGAIDWEKLSLDGRREIFRGDGSELAYVTALYHAFVAVPQGHQGFYLKRGCGELIPFANNSLRGACGRPHTRGIVVTSVSSKNALGLQKGDLVVGLGSARGHDVLGALADRPMCTASMPSASARETFTATTFADLLAPGEEIEVESPDGTTRTVKVPDDAIDVSSALSCTDPFSRPLVVVESEIRPDGVGVIRLPGFTDPEQKFPVDGTGIDQYRAKFEAKILAAFEKVKSAPAIVWDVRGNGGGLTLVGLNIASGFPGARAEPISYCEVRKPDTDPPAFEQFSVAEYLLTPGGPFAYSGKVAVLIDGLDYSAADYFPLAIKTRTNATLVGAPSAGAFGATSGTKSFDGPPAFDVSIDVYRCSSSETRTPLEGNGITPHVAVEYDPKDLAAGKDTVLERAVSLVK